MKPEEINKKIDALYDELEDFLIKGIFVLNPRVAEINEEIDQLRSKCPHEFNEFGECIYCYYDKDEEEEE